MILVWEDARVWAHSNHSFDIHFNYLGAPSYFSPSWIHSEPTLGVTEVPGSFMVSTSFVYWNGRQHSLSTAYICIQWDAPLLIINKGTFWLCKSGLRAIFWIQCLLGVCLEAPWALKIFWVLLFCNSSTLCFPYQASPTLQYKGLGFCLVLCFGLWALRSPARNWTWAPAVKA